MKFNRLALRQAALDAIEVMRDEHNAEQARLQAVHNDKEADWVDKHGDAWRAACKVIMAKLRKGQPIVDGDLPTREPGYSRTALFYDRRPQRVEFKRPQELVELVTALDVVAEETVTANGLASVGMTRGAIAAAVRHLAAGQVKA